MEPTRPPLFELLLLLRLNPPPRVGDVDRELAGEDAEEEGVEEEGVEVDVGACSLHKKKLAELFVASVDSANCRFCCSKKRFRSDWKARRRDVLRVGALGSKDSRGAGLAACLF